MVQCCLGESWEERCDVDLFCTVNAAPAVRSWLVKKETGHMFVGFCDTYVGVENLTYPVDSKIHHVEYYAQVPRRGGAEDLEDSGFDYDQACKYGANVNTEYVRDKSRIFHANGHSRHSIRPLKGDDFPFNFDNDRQVTIDLVVARDECTSARALLEDFDMNIYKASWDGQTFHIPDPHLTFSRRSRTEPTRKVLMRKYMQYYDEDSMGNIEAAVTRVWSDRSEKNWTSNAFQLHNFVYNLFDRLRKYQDRSIVVEDAPGVVSCLQYGGLVVKGDNAADFKITDANRMMG
jgi:hypothetical protein